jgi:hypothetical protein
LLFSCRACAQDDSRQLQVVLSQPGKADQIIDYVPVDIRPVQNWVGLYSARAGSFGGNPPVNPVAEDGWTNQIPTNANVTVLVHGFSVTDDDMRNYNLPRWTKRFYWTEHPMFPFQLLANGKKAYTFGFSWSGDASVGGQSGHLQSLYYPQDVFQALESGTTFANFLQLLEPAGGGTNTVNLFVHSLGNMMANQALTQVLDGTVSTYVMNEAAVPAEAFFSDESQYAIEQIDSGSCDPSSPSYNPSPLNCTRPYAVHLSHRTENNFGNPCCNKWVSLELQGLQI